MKSAMHTMPHELGSWFLIGLLVGVPLARAGKATLAENGTVQDQFDVVIAGGSTAAFAAAVASAQCGARTALLEPTDWVGGQLTASGVPAVDEAWHTVVDPDPRVPPLRVSLIARDPRNITPNFFQSLQGLPECGDCWVSRFCFRPQQYLSTQLLPLQAGLADKLTVFSETVVKKVILVDNGTRIAEIVAIRRQPKNDVAAGGYDLLPSQDLGDWYSPVPSARFEKELLRFGSANSREPVFIEATEWGELLALSGAEYLQGLESAAGSEEGTDRCGQSTVFCFVQELHPQAVAQQDPPGNPDQLGYGDYRDKDDAWERIWTYRRIRGEGPPAAGDLCLQNWGFSGKLQEGGNDYPFGYLFKAKKDTDAERADWRGGINLATLAGAEQRALGWHHWFRRHAPPGIEADQITLAGKELGTGHGLAKLPYIRDTRRAIGLDRFVLQFQDLSGSAGQRTGTRFEDRVALGAYPADVHPLSGCQFPREVVRARETLPYYIPFRALTHYHLENVLVAGKTMAQSFLVNSATRLHPIEWSSGTAAGVAAAYMARTGKTSRQALASIRELQELVQTHTPIDWSFPDQN